ncbi:hypothetical protein DSO57_1001440 [Entomophthora muscae]|uniref:Uncharacterized protein n=1 Tax=Entomophthora muscae TaxID=34485 RepID=A0ACC2UHY6_9FUNG|nr:hypothetical protein DSO57_1001440 [Entomophthora muscae]
MYLSHRSHQTLLKHLIITIQNISKVEDKHSPGSGSPHLADYLQRQYPSRAIFLPKLFCNRTNLLPSERRQDSDQILWLFNENPILLLPHKPRVKTWQLNKGIKKNIKI